MRADARPFAGNRTCSRGLRLANIYRSYKAAIGTAAETPMWNPMGELDEKFFVPAIWRERQIKLNCRGAHRTAIGVGAILITQDVFSPIYYALNKALGNGRVHLGWLSTTTGAMANASVKSLSQRRIQQGIVSGLVPSLSRLFTHLGALTGAGVGHIANGLNGKNDAVDYAVWGARAGVYVGWGVTQFSIGVNFVIKSAAILLPGTALVGLTAALLLAARWGTPGCNRMRHADR